MKKNGMIILLCILAIIVALGAGIYFYLFSSEEEIDAQLNEQFSEEFFSFSDINLTPIETIPDKTNINDDSDHSPKQSDSSIDTSSPNHSTNSEVSNETTVEPKTTIETIETIETIKNEYTPKFKKLEDAAVDRLDELFSAGYKEYKEGKLSKTELAKKYIQAGEKLQNGVDGVFYGLLREMEQELKASNLSTDLVKEAEATYKEAIKKKKSELFSKL